LFSAQEAVAILPEIHNIFLQSKRFPFIQKKAGKNAGIY
jgi:hypothetical protein